MHSSPIRRRWRAGFVLGLIALWADPALIAQEAEAASEPVSEQRSDPAPIVALVGGTVHPLDGTAPFEGTVLVRGSEIVELGPTVSPPEGATVVDLSGCQVVPGLIDCRSVLWLTEGARSETSSRGSLSILDGVDLWQSDWRDVARAGVTAVYVQPSSGSSLGGVGAVLRVAEPRDLEDLSLRARAGAQAAVGLASRSATQRRSEFQRLETALRNVAEGNAPGSLEDEDEEEAEPEPPTRRGRGGRGGRGFGGFRGRGGASAPSQPDETEELLREVVKGNLPLRLELHHADALGWALDLAAELKLDLVFEGLSQPGEPGCLGARDRVVLGPVWELGDTPSYREDRPQDWLARSTDAARWALGTFSTRPAGSAQLRLHAAAALAQGADRDAVLRAMTSQAAEILGIDDRVGRLAVGKRADLAVFAGDPLDPTAPVRLVMSHGTITYQDAGARPRERMTSTDARPLSEGLPAETSLQSERMLIEGKLQLGTLVVADGTIRATSVGIPVAAGAPPIDLGDAVLTPAFVAASSHLGQRERLADGVDSDASQFRTVDAVDVEHEAGDVLLRHGLVHVALAPNAVNTSAGMVAQLRLGTEAPAIADDLAGLFSLAAGARNDDRYPASLAGQLALLEELWSGRPPPTRLLLPPSAQRLLLSDRRALAGAVGRGERRAIIAAHTAVELRCALDLIEQFGVVAAIEGPVELAHEIDRLVALGVGIIARPATEELGDDYPAQLAMASRAGVPVAFTGDRVDQMRATAARAVAAGMDPVVALEGLCTTAAALCGMDSGTACLQSGSHADFLIWDDNPVHPSARLMHVVVDGEIVE